MHYQQTALVLKMASHLVKSALAVRPFLVYSLALLDGQDYIFGCAFISSMTATLPVSASCCQYSGDVRWILAGFWHTFSTAMEKRS